jgi:hypothetical protein
MSSSVVFAYMYCQAVKTNLQQEPLQQLLEEVKSVLDDDTQVGI